MDTILHAGKFVSLKQIEGDGYKYEYSHESRCDGQIVAVLPVSLNHGMLIRRELTPCWGEGYKLTSITGGWEKSKHATPIDTVLAELREEAGVVLNDETCVRSLGTCRGGKSSDTLYHLFLVDLSDENLWEQVLPETDGSVLEAKEYSEWVDIPFALDGNLPAPEDSKWLEESPDPLLYVMYTRWMIGRLHKPVSREDYA